MKRHQSFEFIIHDPTNKTKRRIARSNSSSLNRHSNSANTSQNANSAIRVDEDNQNYLQTDHSNSEINDFGSQTRDRENANDVDGMCNLLLLF